MRLRLRKSWTAIRLAPVVREDRKLLKAERAIHEKQFDASDHEPLVSIVIPTYNRGELLVRRTLPTVLNQTYRALEILVVGDRCTDETERLMGEVKDPRVQFFNLAQRGEYPQDPMHHWMVAGSVPINTGMDMAKGKWIAHLDDDECFEPDHVEALLGFARAKRAEVACGRTRVEKRAGEWKVVEPHLEAGRMPHSAVLFRSYLRLFKFDVDSWKLDMAVDRHTWTRMIKAGVRFAVVDRIVTTAPLRPGTTDSHFRAEDRAGYIDAP